MTERTNRIAEFRKRANLTQAELAERVDSHWVTISKLERGKMHLTFDWAERLGKALGINEFDLFEERESEKTVFIDGAIGDRGKVYFYADEDGKEAYEAVIMPLGMQRSTRDVWVQIETDDFFPVLNVGDFVRLTYLAEDEDPAKYVGRLMAASSHKVEDPIVMGVLTHGAKAGEFEIRALSGAPRSEMMKVERLLAVSLIVPMPPIYDQITTSNPPAAKDIAD